MNYPVDDIVMYDLEVFPGYFLAGFKLPDGTVFMYEFAHGRDDYALQLVKLRHFIDWIEDSPFTLAGFNSGGYDDLVLTPFLEDGKTLTAYETSVDIIVNGKPPWDFKNYINSIDLMQVLPGRIGLKKIGVCLGHKRLQELPIAYNKQPTPEEQEILRGYNLNDLEITGKLYEAVRSELDLRRVMSERYKVDLRSKGEATMAEAAILEEYKTLGGTKTKKDFNREAHRIVSVRPRAQVYKPTWWEELIDAGPGLPQLRELGQTVFETLIPIEDGRLSKKAMSRQLFIDDRYYTMGVGGLHSVDGPGCWIPKSDEILVDIDVASYYPNIMITQNLSPRQWGKEFQTIYKDIVERRLSAKRSGDKVTANVLKIAANGTFGKSSDIYSALYDPQLTANVTVLGQLGLLTLIGMLEGIATVCSANTDGITVLVHRAYYPLLTDLVSRWEQATELEMEYTEYVGLWQKDVNNYVAVTVDGKTKTKGRFVDKWPDLRHTPNANIVATAIKNQVTGEALISETIAGCRDINQFILTQSVTGNFTTSWQGKPLGKMLRFYKSNSAKAAPIIRSPGEGDLGNEGIVANSDGCIPLEDLPDTFPKDINYAWYIKEALDLWDVIRQPKRPGMNRWAEVLHQAGLRPCLVDAGATARSRVKVSYGGTDFTSMPPGWEFGTSTGNGLMALVEDDQTQLMRVENKYPTKTRKKVKKDTGFELIYGGRVTLKNTGVYRVQDSRIDLDEFYTPGELRKVRQ